MNCQFRADCGYLFHTVAMQPFYHSEMDGNENKKKHETH